MVGRASTGVIWHVLCQLACGWMLALRMRVVGVSGAPQPPAPSRTGANPPADRSMFRLEFHTSRNLNVPCADGGLERRYCRLRKKAPQHRGKIASRALTLGASGAVRLAPHAERHEHERQARDRQIEAQE